MTRPINIRGIEAESLVTTTGPSNAFDTRLLINNGRVFRYARAGNATLARGTLVRVADRKDGHANLSVAALTESINVVSFTATLTHQSMTLDEYKDGLVYVNDVDGQGQVFTVEKNTLTRVAGTVTVVIGTPLNERLTTNSQVTFIKNRYDGVKVTESVATQQAIGVVPVAVTANSYFWLQTYGPAAILQNGSLYENCSVQPSEDIDGAVESAKIPLATGNELSDMAFGTMDVVLPDIDGNERKVKVAVVNGISVNNSIGYSIDPRADTEYSLVYLTIIN